MFETLFQNPAVVTRQRSGPFAEARERFLNHCASQGLARATLVRRARELLIIAERIDITLGEAIGLSTIESAADRWAREQRQRQRAHGVRWSQEFFIQIATDWLHFLGRLEVPKPKIMPFADRLADFAAYQRDERGLSIARKRGRAVQCPKRRAPRVRKFVLGWKNFSTRRSRDEGTERTTHNLAKDRCVDHNSQMRPPAAISSFPRANEFAEQPLIGSSLDFHVLSLMASRVERANDSGFNLISMLAIASTV
jgi:hypothetical protein